MSSKGLSFIVPVYNEEASIVDTLKRLHKTLSGLQLPFEILLVDDGSTDLTHQRALEVADVRILRHPVNIGYGNALKTGIRQVRYEWVGFVDADGSYPIEDTPLLLRAMEEGFDMAVGSRSNLNAIDGFTKRMFRAMFGLLVRFLNDSRIEDPNSGFRILKRDIVIRLMPFLCGKFSFTTSLTVLMSGLYGFIKYVPVTYTQRVGRSKVRHFRDSLATLQYIAQGILFFNPIKFFLILVAFMVTAIFLPSLAIALTGHTTLSLYCMLGGTTGTLLLGMAGLADVIRIASER